MFLIDQRQLPDKVSYFVCEDYHDVVFAIANMVVRGAPAIGVSGAFGLILADIHSEDIQVAAAELINVRPTAVNLSWAINRVLSSDSFLDEALLIYNEDLETNKLMGDFGSKLISDGDTILTHCNAGALACVGYGTALGVVRSAFNEGKNINVVCDETRPLGQGARLSVWELQQDNIPVTLISDVAAGYLMQKNEINKVIIGADRVAKGGVVNKIGSFMVALAAKRFNIPFYVVAPLSTFDSNISVFDVPIENRSSDEVMYYGGCRICPEDTNIQNPAFDIVPTDLITNIITEKGIINPL